ncbi:regucalcin-like [Limulus polyphemus]|uniref:Regucalcin n=1 Tax=Limulus polyphemus TaxID=6850 RepID=A0ABM1BRN9_LIMPO|nr:regucalcin-like [Limulus polyphemus]
MVVSVTSKRLSSLGEGPHWDEKSKVLWHVDALSGDVCRLDVETQETDVVHLNGKVVSLVIPYASDPDKLVVTVDREIRQLSWKNQSCKLLQEVDLDKPDNNFNDGKCDKIGRLWAGTKAFEKIPTVIEPEQGTLYSLDSDLLLRKHVDKISISNGMVWNLGYTIMFYIDSFLRKIYAFDFDLVHGTLSNQRTLVDFNVVPAYQECGFPDGMTIDCEGKLWVACYDGGRIIRIDPETAQILRTVKFPVQKITSCCFGGPNYDELFVTSAWVGLSDDMRKDQPQAGAVFRVSELGVTGLPHERFAG